MHGREYDCDDMTRFYQAEARHVKDDHFHHEINVVDRLVDEWRKHGKLIIAYDFDGTVHDFHKKGHTYTKTIALIRRCREIGAHLIVYTCRPKEQHDEVIKYLNENDIPFDKVNEDMDFITFGGGKIYYNHLLDDRAGLPSAYRTLVKAVEIISKGEI